MTSIQKTISSCIHEGAFSAVSPTTTVLEAILDLRASKRECVLVTENNKIRGIFTERDFLNRVIVCGLSPGKTPISEVMTPNPDTLGTEDSIAFAINRMAVRKFRNIPILDSDDKPLAVLSVRDVIKHLSEVLKEVGENRVADSPDWDPWTDIGGG